MIIPLNETQHIIYMTSVNTEYNILLLGNVFDNHMVRFVKNLKRENTDVKIDAFTPRQAGRTVPVDYLSCFNEFNVVDFSCFFIRVPLLRTIEIVINWKRTFKTFSKGRHYDVVNIHFPRYILFFILRDLVQIAHNIVISPWGSDVYRISGLKKILLKHVFDAADYVTCHGSRFTRDVKKNFCVPDRKIRDLFMGSETIDYILEHLYQCSVDNAKKKLGVENSFVITCGYNASEGQQHLRIIEAISQIKDDLPTNLVLLFPLTYPKNVSYVQKIKDAVEKIHINALYFTEYLDLEKLFVLRQATDMFIHVQITDANSASLKEYILLRKICINGSWLVYDDLEDYNCKSYYSVSSLEELPSVLLKALHNGTPIISDTVIQNIASLGWTKSIKEWDCFFKKISS